MGVLRRTALSAKPFGRSGARFLCFHFAIMRGRVCHERSKQLPRALRYLVDRAIEGRLVRL